ncbi:type II toxin-antitoxin system HicA family toxin [Muricoccus roseus]|uniref:type II toxin-antitoxin system HicA family toxin n=1 Tax=Muricoccus roseus TaxID=198092 RepID=UPI000933B6E9|nr:type II toxin-antitoxin system HicA family toxin [Roseomonas rosea]
MESLPTIPWNSQVWFKSTGSHRQYRHPTKPGRVTVAFHGGAEEVHPKTLASIAHQSGVNLKGK